MKRDAQGRPLTERGHILEYDPKNPCARKNGMVLAHHKAWYKKTGSCPVPGLVVHHKDHRKSNNDPGNLEQITTSEHSLHHKPGLRNREKKQSCEAQGGKIRGLRQKCVKP